MREGPMPHRQIAGFTTDEVWGKDRLHIEVLTDRPALLLWQQEERAPRFWLFNLADAHTLADGLGRAIEVLERRVARGQYPKEETKDAHEEAQRE